MTIAGTVFGGTNAFPGATGALWDNRVDDVTAAVMVGATSITTLIDAQNDCLAWSMNGVVLEDLGGAVMTPRLPTRAPSSQDLRPRPTGTRGGVGN